MAFRYTYLMPTDGNWGGRLPNGAWGGQVGLVVRNECDVAVGPLALTNDRVSAMRPLPAYFYADASHMAGRREVYYSDVFGYIYAFDEQVWIGIVLALATVAILMVMFQNNFRFAGATEKLLEYIFLLFAMLLTKGPSRCPKNTRVLIGVWWLAVVFATTSFTSHMQASMAIKTEVPRLESVADIIKHRRIVPTIIDGMAFDVFFKTSANPDDQELWRRVQQHKSQLSFNKVFLRETYEAVLDGRQVVFMEQSLYHYGIRRHYSREPPKGQFYFGKINVLTVPCAIFVSYNASKIVQESLHQTTRWICESGLIDRHLEQALLQTWRQAGNRPNTVEAIRAEDISGLFAVWIMGMSMAAVGTVGEAVMEWRRRSGAEVSRFGLRRRRNRLKRTFP
ncbi:putative glutamate receptor [Rhipicephalus microplus]|uniref:putative glutamate receptor n=1 Tax=Rhipicephalus microplus TaxID=6941 RepID=UPI003F6BA9CD